MIAVVVDTSVIVAVLTKEPEAIPLLKILNDPSTTLLISAVSVLETGIVLRRKGFVEAAGLAQAFFDQYGVETIDFDHALADIAAQAFEAFGKGRHPAALNFGDCAVYATAKELGAPLLALGADFAQTDIPVAELQTPAD